MKRLRIALLLLAAAVLFGALRSVRGQSGGFIIQNADDSTTLSFTSSSALESLLDQVAPRFVVQFGDDNEYYPLTSLPATLSTLLDNVAPRFVIEFANSNRFLALTPLPGQLDTLLGQIEPRFIMQFANASREVGLSFPLELIDDTTPPQVSNIEADPAGPTSTVVRWRTDEYATSTAQCGVQSGAYTETYSDALYVKEHAVTVSGFAAGTTVYCRVSGEDQSGNSYQSAEFSFTQVEEAFIYLPLLLEE